MKLATKKIQTRLTRSFIMVALLVAFVGYVTISSQNKIQENNKLESQITEMICALDSSLILSLELVTTQNLDDFRDTKSKIENTINEHDILHEKIMPLLNGQEEIESHIEYTDKFNKVSNSLIATHRQRLVQNKEFDEKTTLEKKLRYEIKTPLLASGNITLIEQFGSLEYFSKEAIYQYKDEEHIDEWLGAIMKLEKLLTDPDTLEKLKSYRLVALSLSEIVLEQELTKSKKNVKIEELKNIINSIHQNNESVTAQINSDTSSLVKNSFLVSLAVIIFSFFAAIILGIYISKSISKPIQDLSQTSKAIADGDLTRRVEIKSYDELNQLADNFNTMAASLQKSNKNLKQQVKDRTKELNQQVDTLKKFNKLMVNRELKMVELKKRIKELEEKK